MKRALTISVALLFLVLNVSWGQEAETADSIFKWFPQGSYLSMNHRNFASLKLGKAYPLYEKYVQQTGGVIIGDDEKKKPEKSDKAVKSLKKIAFSIHEGGFYFGLDSKLPKQFEEGLLSSTKARYSIFEKVENIEELHDIQEQNKESGKKSSTTMIMMAEATSKDGEEPAVSNMTIMMDNGATMTVHRFLNLAENIDAALKEGTLVRTGKKIAGKPVYSFANQEKGDRSAKLFAWTTPENELLVCDNLKLLREMIKAGNGDTMRLLDDEDYVDLVQLLPDLGSSWSLSASGKTRKQFEKELDSSDLTSEQRDRRKEENEKRELLSISSWKVTDKLIKAKYQVFHTNDAAELAKVNDKTSEPDIASMFMSDSNDPAMTEYTNMIKERTQKEVNGNIFVNSVVYDEQLFKAKERANEALSQAIMNNNGRFKLKGKDGQTMEFHMDTTKEGGTKVKIGGMKVVGKK